MAIQEADIVSKLSANYEAAINLIPPDMVEEFKRKVLPPDYFKSYAKPILVALEFKDETSMVRVQNWIVDRFKKGNFGRKLAAANADPVKIYERLLEGVFDTRFM